ncbi:reverse transcriptase, RNA-dependent DNA polymerase [Tanacetum coccineum]
MEAPNSSALIGHCKAIFVDNDAYSVGTCSNETNKLYGVSFISDCDVQVTKKENEGSLGVFPCQLPPKELNPRSFTLSFEMADMSKKALMVIVENVLVKINRFIFPSNFVVIDMLGDPNETMILGNNKDTIDNIICQLGSTFALKDLRPLNYFLGIEIVPHVSGILLSQKKYILELLQRAGLSNYNSVSSPMLYHVAEWAGDFNWGRESKYKALADTVIELTWLQALLHELGIRSSLTLYYGVLILVQHTCQLILSFMHIQNM